jgi:rhodanese-related sulfurtransferase
MTANHYDFERAQAWFQDRVNFTTGVHELDVLLNGDTDPAAYQVVDVRFPGDFAREHVPGAINLPMPKWENKRWLQQHLNKDATQYLYCYTPTCHLAAQAATKLTAAGYKVVEVEGGWERWLQGGYAVEKAKVTASA